MRHSHKQSCKVFSSAIDGNLLYDKAAQVKYPTMEIPGYPNRDAMYAAISGVADALLSQAESPILFKYVEQICVPDSEPPYQSKLARDVIGPALDMALIEANMAVAAKTVRDDTHYNDICYNVAESMTRQGLVYQYHTDPDEPESELSHEAAKFVNNVSSEYRRRLFGSEGSAQAYSSVTEMPSVSADAFDAAVDLNSQYIEHGASAEDMLNHQRNKSVNRASNLTPTKRRIFAKEQPLKEEKLPELDTGIASASYGNMVSDRQAAAVRKATARCFGTGEDQIQINQPELVEIRPINEDDCFTVTGERDHEGVVFDGDHDELMDLELAEMEREFAELEGYERDLDSELDNILGTSEGGDDLLSELRDVLETLAVEPTAVAEGSPALAPFRNTTTRRKLRVAQQTQNNNDEEAIMPKSDNVNVVEATKEEVKRPQVIELPEVTEEEKPEVKVAEAKVAEEPKGKKIIRKAGLSNARRFFIEVPVTKFVPVVTQEELDVFIIQPFK